MRRATPCGAAWPGAANLGAVRARPPRRQRDPGAILDYNKPAADDSK